MLLYTLAPLFNSAALYPVPCAIVLFYTLAPCAIVLLYTLAPCAIVVLYTLAPCAIVLFYTLAPWAIFIRLDSLAYYNCAKGLAWPFARQSIWVIKTNVAFSSPSIWRTFS